MAAVLAVLLVGTGCSSESKKTSEGDSPKTVKSAGPPPPKVSMTPADGATDVAPASPVTVELEKGELRVVQLRSAKGDVVAGAVEPGGGKWVSKGKLAFGATYTVEVTTGETPTPQPVGKFSTVAAPTGSRSIKTSSVLGDGKTYGIGMPIILKLDDPLSTKEQRAAFENTLSVKSTPPTAGAWGWVNNKEVHFRPAKYWAAGSNVHAAVDSAGRDLGGGKWGRVDLTVDFKIGLPREMRIASSNKQMQVFENGKLVRTIPVSLGRPKYPSSKGTMVVIDKRPKALFDSSTYGLPVNSPDGYKTEVQYPIRLTWGGEFIHSAPWSVGQQGRVNVSHGCVNVAPANAVWLYNRVQVGDPVVVTGTEEAVKWGDGWMEWSLSFADWLKHSATGEHPTS